MSRFSVLVGLLVVSLIVFITNWPLIEPQLALAGEMLEQIRAWVLESWIWYTRAQ